MSSKDDLWFLISCGWAVRNYITSNFLNKLKEIANLVLIVPEEFKSFGGRIEREMGINVEYLKKFRFNYILSFINGALVIADNYRLGFWDKYYWKWMVSLNPKVKRPYLYLQKIFGKVLSKRKSVYNLIKNFEDKIINYEISKMDFKSLSKLKFPKLLISTHPYSLYEFYVSLLPFLKDKIKLGSIISWDNLTYKGHLLGKYEYFVVWGPTMKEDLLSFYPKFDEKKIFEIGSPQFDFYFKEELYWEKDYFFNKINGDKNKKLILYSANTCELFPDEDGLVELIFKNIKNGNIKDSPQLLVRIHPHDTSERFLKLKDKYKEILVQKPYKNDSNFFWWFEQDIEDMQLLANTLKYCDLNINMCSSMTLDAAIFDKPIINVAFSTNPKNPKAFRIPHNHKAPHYKRIIDQKAVKIAFNEKEFIDYINLYLEKPYIDSEERKRIVQIICGKTDGKASQRLLDLIYFILKENEKN